MDSPNKIWTESFILIFLIGEEFYHKKENGLLEKLEIFFKMPIVQKLELSICIFQIENNVTGLENSLS
jgi:hypothetical protein